jgi:hypothetical protein
MRIADDMARLLFAGLCLAAPLLAQASEHLGSKTPYAPRGDAARYEAAPAGFVPVAVQLVARHGSRGLTKPGSDEAALALWREAEAQGALTPLGRRFGADLQRFIQAQQRIGYGNLSALGVVEHEQLAQRLVARLPALFKGGPDVEVLTSGVDRAVDSSRSFVDSLARAAPRSRVPASWGSDRFLLYFHRLSESRDVADTPARQATLKRSLAYQAWVRGPELAAQQRRIDADPRLPPAAQQVLAGLYGAAFAARTPKPLEAAEHVIDLRGAAADLKLELDSDFSAYVPAQAAAVFAEHSDAEDFYRKGPGLADAGPVTYDIATQLLRDMLDRLSLGTGVVLRFAHAETVAPLVSAIGIAGVHQPLPREQPYSYVDSAWRTADVIPMAANVQWEVWRGVEGERLVRMLLNEGEADFKPACDGARLRPGSRFYRVTALLSCYRAGPSHP